MSLKSLCPAYYDFRFDIPKLDKAIHQVRVVGGGEILGVKKKDGQHATPNLRLEPFLSINEAACLPVGRNPLKIGHEFDMYIRQVGNFYILIYFFTISFSSIVLGTRVTDNISSPMYSVAGVLVSVMIRLRSVCLLGGRRLGSRDVIPMKSSWKPQS